MSGSKRKSHQPAESAPLNTGRLSDVLPRIEPSLRRYARYWWVVAIATVFTLARFSEAFLILRVQSIGLPPGFRPIVLVITSLVYSQSGYPTGSLSDRMDRVAILILGLLLLVLADLALTSAASLSTAALGVALWDLHMGFTQGLLSTLIAETVPAELRGTAFGTFNLVTGVALLAASVIAGALWDATGPQGTFLVARDSPYWP